MFQRRLLMGAATVAVLALCSQSALAQRPGGGGGRFGGMMGGGGGMLGLLRMEPVQKELGLTAEQTTKATKIAEEMQAEMRESMANFRDMSQEERREAGEKMAKKTAEYEKKVTEDLKPEQTARLKELSIQRRGVSALMDPKVAEALKLTDDQKTQLREVMTAAFPRPGQGGGGADGGDRAAIREQMTKAREESEKKSMAVLDDGQKTEFKKMQGKKFEFPAGPAGGPGGPGGGQGGNRRRANTDN